MSGRPRTLAQLHQTHSKTPSTYHLMTANGWPAVCGRERGDVKHYIVRTRKWVNCPDCMKRMRRKHGD